MGYNKTFATVGIVSVLVLSMLAHSAYAYTVYTNTVAGVSDDSNGIGTTSVWAQNITASASGTLTSIGIDFHATVGPNNVVVAIYADNGTDGTGAGAAALLMSNMTIMPDTTIGFYDFPIGNVSIVAGTEYWLAFNWYNGDSVGVHEVTSGNPSKSRTDAWAGAGAMPNPFGSATNRITVLMRMNYSSALLKYNTTAGYLGSNTTIPDVGKAVKMFSYLTGESGLNYTWLATNESGAWENKTKGNVRNYDWAIPVNSEGTGSERGAVNFSDDVWVTRVDIANVSNTAPPSQHIFYICSNDVIGSGVCDKNDKVNGTVGALIYASGQGWYPYTLNKPFLIKHNEYLFIEQNQVATWNWADHITTNVSGIGANSSIGYTYRMVDGHNMAAIKLYVGNKSYMEKLNGVTDWTWANTTWTNASVPYWTAVGWRMYFNDSTGAESVTGISNFTVTVPPSGPQYSNMLTKYTSPVLSDPSKIHGFQIDWNAGGMFNTTNVTFRANFSGAFINYTNATSPVALYNTTPSRFILNLTNGNFTGGNYFEYKWYAANGTGESTIENSTSFTGYTVSNVAATSCNGTVSTPSKVFRFYNETIDFAKINSTIEIVLLYSDGSVLYNTSTTNETFTFCVYPAWANYSIDGLIRYTNSSYSQRDYWFENMKFDSVLSYTNLFLLNTNLGSRVKFTVKDATGNLYPDVIINIQRYYPETFEYRTVAAPKTDALGSTLSYVVKYDVYYRYVLTKDGLTLYTSTPALISSDDIIISVEPGVLLDWLKYGSKIRGSCIYSVTTGNVTCEYSDSSGYLTGADLEVKQIGALINSVVCTNTSSTVPHGHISCHFGNATNDIYSYALTGNISTDDIIIIVTGALNEGSLDTKLFGNCGSAGNLGSCREGLVIVFFMTLTGALIGIYNPPVSIAFMMMIVGVTWYIGLLAISLQMLIGLIFVAAIVMFRLARGES